MDINFANTLFPRHCFIAKLFLFFCFFLPDLVSRDYCKIYSSDLHNFLLFFQFIPFKKDEGLNFSSFSKIEENNLFSSLSCCFFFFGWLFWFSLQRPKHEQLTSILMI